MKKHIANVLTGCRILGSVLMLFCSVFSLEFYIIYILCGFTDMIDGTIARKTNSVSVFGCKLDTVADLLFVVVSLFKLWRTIQIPVWLWVWGGTIAVIKFSNIVWGYMTKKQFASLHTNMNKVTGLLLFLLPFMMHLAQWKVIAIAVCFIATLSAIQEGIYIFKDSVLQKGYIVLVKENIPALSLFSLFRTNIISRFLYFCNMNFEK